LALVKFVTILFAAVAIAGSAAAKPQSQNYPVRIGGDSGDACAARVTTLNTYKGRPILVRSGPGNQFPILDLLWDAEEWAIYICDAYASGAWRGIVYTFGPGERCGVSRARPKRVQYNGDCAQGWIRSADIKDLAD